MGQAASVASDGAVTFVPVPVVAPNGQTIVLPDLSRPNDLSNPNIDKPMYRNVGTGKCISGIESNKWGGFKAAACNPYQGNQWMTYNPDKSISSGQGQFMLVDGSHNVASFDDKSKGSYDYTITSIASPGKTGNDALEFGAFQINSIGQAKTSIAASDDSLTNPSSSGDTNQSWISNKLAATCESLGISIGKCTKDSLTNCENPANQKDFNKCPLNYCTSGRLGEAQCQQWAIQNGNSDIDARVKEYCSSNPSDLNFCGCYNFTDEVKATQKKLEANGQNITPWCNIGNCSSNTNAYKPYNRDKLCPTQQICIQSIDVGSTQAASFTGIDFSCKNDAVITSTTVNQTSNTTTSTDTKPTATPSTLTPSAAVVAPVEGTYKEQAIQYSKDNPFDAILGGIAFGLLLIIILILIYRTLRK